MGMHYNRIGREYNSFFNAARAVCQMLRNPWKAAVSVVFSHVQIEMLSSGRKVVKKYQGRLKKRVRNGVLSSGNGGSNMVQPWRLPRTKSCEYRKKKRL
jgi:hypothetical protein